MNSPRTQLYRDKHNGKFLGVCAGIADYIGVNALWVRLAVVLLTFGGFGWLTLPGYFAMGIALKSKPDHLYAADPAENRYWQRVRQNPKRTAREIRGQFRDIDRRLADVEHFYVSSNPRLSAEIEKLR